MGLLHARCLGGAGADADGQVVQLIGAVLMLEAEIGHLLAQALGQGVQLSGIGDLQEHDELFATIAVDIALALTQAGADAASDLAQALVADLMTIVVVEGLEEVDVQQQQGEGPAVALHLLPVIFQSEIEGAAVADAGQRVGAGLFAQAQVERRQFVALALLFLIVEKGSAHTVDVGPTDEQAEQQHRQVSDAEYQHRLALAIMQQPLVVQDDPRDRGGAGEDATEAVARPQVGQDDEHHRGVDEGGDVG